MKQQKGFTLVELMVSIVLGLLVSAAAIQLYITSQKSMVIQRGAANLQNSASLGLEYMLRNIRLANLNAAKPLIDPTVLHGGIVLNHSNLSTKNTFSIDGESESNSLMTQGSVGPSNLQGESSDQLVIQYRNRNVQGNILTQYNCEGELNAPDAYIIERYFIREDSKSNNDPNAPLVLACKATSYTADDASTLSGLNDNSETKNDDGEVIKNDGVIIIPRVDHMRILLGVASDVDNTSKSPAEAGQDGVLDRFGYINIEDYKKLTVKPQIVSIQIGMLVRSPDSIGKNDLRNDTLPYKVLDIEKALKIDNKNNLYGRQVITQTVALRNGFGLQENPQ